MTTPPTSQTNPLDPVFSGVPVVYPQTGMVSPTWNKWFVDLREKVNVINATVAALSGGTLKPVIEVHAGTNVAVDNTDPQNPIISSTGGALPSGGTAGQVLTKIDSTPGNADWQTPSGGGSSNYLVPPFADVSALLHCNGPNGSTTFTDQVTGNTWTANNATISTAQSLYSGSSGLFTGASNSAIVMPTNSGFNVGTGNWTLEFSVYPNGAHQTGARLFQTRNGDVYAGISLQLSSGQTFVLYMSSTGSSWDILSGGTGITLTSGVWNKVLIQRVGGFVQFYVNGLISSTSTISASAVYYNSADSIILGGQTSGTSRSINAYLAEVRFTKGLALVISYPPLTAEFPNS